MQSEPSRQVKEKVSQQSGQLELDPSAVSIKNLQKHQRTHKIGPEVTDTLTKASLLDLHLTCPTRPVPSSSTGSRV